MKKSHLVSYQKFLQSKEPGNYLSFNPEYTSPFTSNSEYLIDHTKTKGKLRNYDPLKQSFLFLPNENPKRPIIVPQEYLIIHDDSLLQEIYLKIYQILFLRFNTKPLNPLETAKNLIITL